MKDILFTEFESLFKPIQQYTRDYDKHCDALKIIYPDSYATPYLGADLLDSYINLLEKQLELNSNWLAWFVFENDFGNKKLQVSKSKNTPMIEITNLRELYDFLKGEK